MDLWTLVRIVFRQWRVVAPVILLTALAGALLVVRTPDVNQTSASIILVPLVPDSAAVRPATGVQADPLASPDLAAQALAAVVSSDSSASALRQQGAVAGYSVTKETSGPLLRVQAEGADPDVVLGTARAVIDRVVAELDARQTASNVREDQRLRADVLAVPEGTRPGAAPNTFVASGSVLLVGADPQGLSIESNPYARLAESTSPVLSGLAEGQDFRRMIEASGVEDEEFEIDPDTRAAVIYLVTRSSSAATAERTANTLIGAFRAELTARQTALGLPQEIWFTFTVLAPPTTEQLPPDLLRSLVALAAVGGLVAVSAAVVAENRRAARVRAAAPAAGHAVAGANGSPAPPPADGDVPRPAPTAPPRTAPGPGPVTARGTFTGTGGRVRALPGDEAWMPAERP